MQASGTRRDVRTIRKSADYMEVFCNEDLKGDMPHVPRRRRRKNADAQFGQPKYNVFECIVGTQTFRALTLNLLKTKISRGLSCHVVNFSKVGGTKGERVLLMDDQGKEWLWLFMEGAYQTHAGDEITVSNGCAYLSKHATNA